MNLENVFFPGHLSFFLRKRKKKKQICFSPDAFSSSKRFVNKEESTVLSVVFWLSQRW